MSKSTDRISSRALLEFAKALQEKRVLPKDPVIEEVVTVVLPELVVPTPGTYESYNEYVAAFNAEIDETRLPLTVYEGLLPAPSGGEYPVTVNEPGDVVATLTEAHKVTVNDITMTLYTEAGFDTLDTYNGYCVMCEDGFVSCLRIVNGAFGYTGSFMFSAAEKTQIETTKQKRTIKQDYLPNADWSQNDQDGDGYVAGRTHWVDTVELPQAIVEGTYTGDAETSREWVTVFDRAQLPVNGQTLICTPCSLVVEGDPDTTVTVTYTGDSVELLCYANYEESPYRFAAVPLDWDGISEPDFYINCEVLPNASAEGAVEVAGQLPNATGGEGVYSVQWTAETVHQLDNKFIRFDDIETLIDEKIAAIPTALEEVF